MSDSNSPVVSASNSTTGVDTAVDSTNLFAFHSHSNSNYSAFASPADSINGMQQDQQQLNSSNNLNNNSNGNNNNLPVDLSQLSNQILLNMQQQNNEQLLSNNDSLDENNSNNSISLVSLHLHPSQSQSNNGLIPEFNPYFYLNNINLNNLSQHHSIGASSSASEQEMSMNGAGLNSPLNSSLNGNRLNHQMNMNYLSHPSNLNLQHSHSHSHSHSHHSHSHHRHGSPLSQQMNSLNLNSMNLNLMNLTPSSVCKFFAAGHCARGEQCNYAHIPMNQQQGLGPPPMGMGNPKQRGNRGNRIPSDHYQNQNQNQNYPGQRREFNPMGGGSGIGYQGRGGRYMNGGGRGIQNSRLDQSGGFGVGMQMTANGRQFASINMQPHQHQHQQHHQQQHVNAPTHGSQSISHHLNHSNPTILSHPAMQNPSGAVGNNGISVGGNNNGNNSQSPIHSPSIGPVPIAGNSFDDPTAISPFGPNGFNNLINSAGHKLGAQQNFGLGGLNENSMGLPNFLNPAMQNNGPNGLNINPLAGLDPAAAAAFMNLGDPANYSAEAAAAFFHAANNNLASSLGPEIGLAASSDDLLGRVYSLAKDQYGCRILQKFLDEGRPGVLDVVFTECFDHINDLMTDPFGNYLCQKLIEHCSDAQRLAILHRVSNDLVAISLNLHGTRAVQKLVETISTPPEVEILVNSLRASVVTLIKDLNGNHVIQRALHHLSSKDNQFIYDAVCRFCVSVATHKHGCCVLQRCVDYANAAQKRQLVAEIIGSSLELVQDAFGNYVVQYVLDLGEPNTSNQIIANLLGHISALSVQKFSSNVIEKCLELANDKMRGRVVDELVNLERLPRLLQDPYANYVIQKALSVSKKVHLDRLVGVIKPHLHALRNTSFGKRIQNKILKKFPDLDIGFGAGVINGNGNGNGNNSTNTGGGNLNNDNDNNGFYVENNNQNDNNNNDDEDNENNNNDNESNNDNSSNLTDNINNNNNNNDNHIIIAGSDHQSHQLLNEMAQLSDEMANQLQLNNNNNNTNTETNNIEINNNDNNNNEIGSGNSNSINNIPVFLH